MKNFIRSTFQVLLSSLLLFLFLEGAVRLTDQPLGASRFAESVIIREHLSLKKPKGEYRIFAFGESTMHGAHYAPVSSPARWLERYLHDFLPGRAIRVVSFARLGRGSDFAHKTFLETLPYQPDLAVVYLGHNVFLPRNRKADVETDRKSFRCAMRRVMKQSVLISTVYRWVIQKRIEWHKDKPEDRMGFPEIETPPFTFMSNGVTQRNSELYRENIEFFKSHIQQMLKLAHERKIPILFLKPACNLKDFSPSYSLHQKSLSEAALGEWLKFYGEGKKFQSEGDFDPAEAPYLRAYGIDNTYADLSFRLAQVYQHRGDLRKAKKFFEEARDYDALISRATAEVLQVLEDLKRSEGLELLDTEKWLAVEAPGGILGEPIVEDNVHFSLRGHAVVGRHLAQEMARRNYIAPFEAWQFQNERPYEVMAKEMGINEELLFSADLMMVHYFGTHFENRLRFATKALAIHPEDPRALRHLAWTYWLMGERVRALEVYRKLGRSNPEAFRKVFKNLEQLPVQAGEEYQSTKLVSDLDQFKSGFLGRPK